MTFNAIPDLLCLVFFFWLSVIQYDLFRHLRSRAGWLGSIIFENMSGRQSPRSNIYMRMDDT